MDLQQQKDDAAAAYWLQVAPAAASPDTVVAAAAAAADTHSEGAETHGAVIVHRLELAVAVVEELFVDVVVAAAQEELVIVPEHRYSHPPLRLFTNEKSMQTKKLARVSTTRRRI